MWNVLTGRPTQSGIKDYDIFYFDQDTSWEAEDAAIRRVAAAFADTGATIELRNQARVHLWYLEKFGAPYPQLQRATDGIDRFLARASQVGIRRADTGYELYAPHGLGETTAMIVRPNHCGNFRGLTYEAKVGRWKKHWPELTVVPADGRLAPTAAEREATARRWYEENKEAGDSINRFVAEHGLMSDRLRKF